MPATVRISNPRRLPETVRTLRRLGLRLAADGPLTISPASSLLPGNTGPSAAVPPLLVPEATTPARTLARLKKLGLASSAPFFAAGKAGQINAALFAAACLAARDPKLRGALDRFRSRQTSSVPSKP